MTFTARNPLTPVDSGELHRILASLGCLVLVVIVIVLPVALVVYNNESARQAVMKVIGG